MSREYKQWDIKNIDKHENKTLSVQLVSKNLDKELRFKWDGCIDYHKYYNGFTVDDMYTEEMGDNTDYIHICDLQSHIEELQEALRIAKDLLSEDDFEDHYK